MLLNDFYKILEIDSPIEKAGGEIQSLQNVSAKALIEINAGHRIFDGHFPGNPVVPGVCLIQMTKEVLSEMIKNELTMVNADNIKFMAVVNPEVNKILALDFTFKENDGDIIRVSAAISFKGKIFFKIKAGFKYIHE